MNAYELEFYEAGIKDASESRRIVFAASSRRYFDLCRKFRSVIGDKRGDNVGAYNRGVAYEISRQTRLEY